MIENMIGGTGDNNNLTTKTQYSNNFKNLDSKQRTNEMLGGSDMKN